MSSDEEEDVMLVVAGPVVHAGPGGGVGLRVVHFEAFTDLRGGSLYNPTEQRLAWTAWYDVWRSLPNKHVQKKRAWELWIESLDEWWDYEPLRNFRDSNETKKARREVTKRRKGRGL